MAAVGLWTKLHAAHFASKTVGVQLAGASASCGFALLGVALILGTYLGWYKDRDLTLRRYPFPPYILFFGHTATAIYGYSYGIVCVILACALAYGLVL